MKTRYILFSIFALPTIVLAMLQMAITTFHLVRLLRRAGQRHVGRIQLFGGIASTAAPFPSISHMRPLSSLSVLVAIGFAALVPGALGTRPTKDHALSDCVQEAGIILTGHVESANDEGNVGILSVSIIQVLKFPQQMDGAPPALAAGQMVAISNPSFHSQYQSSVESPIAVKVGEAYIFFLKTAPNQRGQYALFDECDGVLQVNQPVLLEIRNRLNKADTVK